MRGVTAVAFGAVLAAFFLVLVAAMVWQEARRRPQHEPAVYALHDAAAYVRNRLPEAIRERLAFDDVLRILEWQVFFLQESVRGVTVGDAEVVVGVTPAAVEYVEERTRTVQHKNYSPEHIEAVLAGQGAYLEEIGALGAPVESEETR